MQYPSLISINSIVRVAVYLGLLFSIYHTTLLFLISQWNREDYTYGYLVPIVFLYLIWEKRKHVFITQKRYSWSGLILLFLGIALFWLGELAGEYFTLYVSLWLVIFAFFFLHLGWEKQKQILFPLVFLITMFPLPAFLHNSVTIKLKLLSSQIGVAIMQLYGMSAYREGNIIDLGFTQLQVVDACSGLRYLFPLLVLGLLLAYFYKATLWKRFILIISTIPITILTNSLRIALTGILYELWGPKVAEGFFHGFSGWLIFMTALGILLFEMWALNGFKSFRAQSSKPKASELQAESSKLKADTTETFDREKAQEKRSLKDFLHPPQFVVAVILLGLTLVLSMGMEFREKVPIAKSFNQFPNRIGEWRGKNQFMEREIIDRLDLNDYIMMNYSNGSGKLVNFYTAYYQSQRKGESIHSPATCLPGSGWIFQEGGSTKIPMPNHNNGFIPVNRAFMIKSGFKQLSYYWFPQRDRILTNAYQLKLYNFWDALTRQRTDGALVRVITPVYDNEDLADAEKRLQSFTQDVVPILDEFLPN